MKYGEMQRRVTAIEEAWEHLKRVEAVLALPITSVTIASDKAYTGRMFNEGAAGFFEVCTATVDALHAVANRLREQIKVLEETPPRDMDFDEFKLYALNVLKQLVMHSEPGSGRLVAAMCDLRRFLEDEQIRVEEIMSGLRSTDKEGGRSDESTR